MRRPTRPRPRRRPRKRRPTSLRKRRRKHLPSSESGRDITGNGGSHPEGAIRRFRSLVPMTPDKTFLSSEDRKNLRAARRRVAAMADAVPCDRTRIQVNPRLELVAVSTRDTPSEGVRMGSGFRVVWRDPSDGAVRSEEAGPADLLALKLVLEERDAEDAAREAGIPVGRIDDCLWGAAARGLIIMPPPRLRRPPSWPVSTGGEDLLAARVFTLQWHITQECDLHCLHCYDRTTHGVFSLSRGVELLDDLRRFCAERFVRGQVSFTGGNPFLHPDFATLYGATLDRGLSAAILGNPVSREQLLGIVALGRPVYYQVSLEGLEAHNDHIRGAGHFRRTLAFLDLLREEGIPCEVMLTLTRDNMDQVLALGEVLRGRADAFSFNRLAPFGEGASLALPEPAAYEAFLDRYVAAMEENPVLALKDNLLNLALSRRGRVLFDGCAGFGCGAAFNFLSVLADGQVHACRKFPSPIGSVHGSSLSELYDSPAAERYRSRSLACEGCRLYSRCGGCPAVTAGLGLDPRRDRDPFCFR
ncbi:thio(seleno)oxazole modification radical SAM maturase SbtM [Geobacter sulfurreducens]|uniref:thio(seleno)oxazole modification radical SAM maturase SbtM n=1 Tax=Geobacter sulfurreducens TaxID=35554 RepID=UPI002D1FB90B|nr:thio(seleno)oxazole modification radical SAM maturase SbtM [Geobacter sulfurreducens]